MVSDQTIALSLWGLPIRSRVGLRARPARLHFRRLQQMDHSGAHGPSRDLQERDVFDAFTQDPT